MNKRHYEHTLPNIRGSLSNTYHPYLLTLNLGIIFFNAPPISERETSSLPSAACSKALSNPFG